MSKIYFSFLTVMGFAFAYGQCPTTGPITLPYFEGFENASGFVTTNTPNAHCDTNAVWAFETSAPGSGRLSFHLGYSNSGSRAATMDRDVGFQLLTNFLTGTLDLSNYDTTGTPYVIMDFYHLDHGDEAHPNDRVWIRGNPNEPWLEIYNLDASGVSGSWVHAQQLNITSTLRNAKQDFSSQFQIRFGQEGFRRASTTTGLDGRSFDDIQLVEDPCPPVGQVSFESSSPTSQLVHFDGSGYFDVEYGLCGFPQGSGTLASGLAPVALTGLMPETCYEVYIRRFCPGTPHSSLAGPFSFTTDCMPKVAPYFESFDSQEWTPSGSGDGSGDGISMCWSRNPEPTLYSWIVRSGPTPTTGTGPSGDHTTGMGNYLATETDNAPYFIDAELYSPMVDISNLSVPQVSFYYHMYGESRIDTLFIDVWSKGAWHNDQLAVKQLAGSSTAPYQKATLHLSGFADTVQLRFRTYNALGSNKRDIAIDDVSFEEGLSCPQPLALAATALSDTSATLSWSSPAATEWLVIYDTAGFDPLTQGSVDTAFSLPYLLENLRPGIPYEVYVVALCGPSGTSDTSNVLYFRTNCATAYTAPYFTGFEQEDDYTVPTCWTAEGSPHFSSFEVISSTALPAASGSKYFYMYSRSSHNRADTILLISPPLGGISQNDKRIRFKARGFAGTDIVVVRLNAASSDSGFVPLDTATLSTTFVYEEFSIYLNSANGHNLLDQYVGLKFQMDPQTSLQIDDFWFEEAPLCTDVDNVRLQNITDTAVGFSVSSQSDSIQYEWGTKGFVLGSGDSAISTAQAISINGLAPGGHYELYIRSLCTKGTTQWQGPFSFRTYCGDPLPVTLPYIEDFETIPTDTFNLPGGIRCDSVSSLEVRKPTGFGEGRALINTDPLFVHSGSKAFSMDEGRSEGSPLTYLGLRLNMSNYSAPHSVPIELSFYHLTNSILANDSDKVLIRGADTAAWIEAFDISAQSMGQTGQYRQVKNIYIDSLLAQHGQDFTESFEIRFGERSRSQILLPGHKEGRGFDDILLREVRCNSTSEMEISGISTHTAQLNWISEALGFIVEYGPRGYVPGNGTSFFTTDTFAVLTGLAAASMYDVYIKDSCSNGFWSVYEGPVPLLTNCLPTAPTTLPFHEGFENFTGAFAQNAIFCDSTHHWKFSGDHWNTRLRFQNDSTYVNTGNVAATLDLSSFYGVFAPTNHLTLFVNLQNYTAAQRINLSFSYMHDNQNSRPHNRVWVRSSDTSQWVEIYDLNANQGSLQQFQDVQDIDIVAPLLNAGQTISNNIQIRFGQQGTAPSMLNFNSDGYSFDDIRLDVLDCAYPIGLNAQGLSDTAATLAWSLPPLFTGSTEVWFGPSGFYQNPAAGSRKTITAASSLLLDTLAPDHCYEYLVRSICAVGDTSSWAGPFAFCTPCSPYTAPYAEDFDNLSASGLPSCWEKIDNDDDDLLVVTFTDHGPAIPSLPNAIELNDGNLTRSSPDTAMLISPPFSDLASGNNQIRFKAANESPLAGGELIIGTMSQPFNGSGFVPYDTLQPHEMTASFSEHTIIMDKLSLIGSNKHIAFLHGSSTYEIYIDDFVYETIPSCKAPQSLTASAVGPFTASLQWSSSNSGGQGYQVEYGPGLAFPGNGTKMGAPGTSLLISGLQPTTDYCFFVREICAVGDTSNWSVAGCFTTACARLSAPHFEDFEKLSLGGGLILENCWETSSTTSPYWTVQQSDGTDLNTLGTGPVDDHTFLGSAPGKYIFLESNIAGDSASLMTPWITVAGLKEPTLSYWCHMYGTGIGALNTWVDTGHGYFKAQAFIGQQQTAQADPWLEGVVSLNPTDSLRIKFTGVVGSGSPWAGDIALDDVYIFDAAECPPPDSISGMALGCDSVLIQWNSTSSGSLVEYGPQGFVLGSGTLTPIVQKSFLVINSLHPGVTYDFYVADTCMSDTSDFVGPTAITTDSLPRPLAQILVLKDSVLNGEKQLWLQGAAGPHTFSWDFGNGQTALGDSVLAVFNADGNYRITLIVSNDCGSDTATLDVPVSLRLPHLRLPQYRIYPNPATNQLHVVISNATVAEDVFVTIVDLSGRAILTSKGKDRLTLDVSRLAAGTYLVEIQQKNNKAQHKIVIR